MLELKGVFAGYGFGDVLHGVEFSVNPGEIVVLMGPNGAGKTTVFRVIAGIIKQSRGSVAFDGRQLTGLAPYQRARLGIGQVPEGRQVVPSLSVQEQLELAGHYAGRLKGKELAQSIAEVYQIFPQLDSRKHRLARTLSGGQQQMLAIARALVMKPRLIIMDEPSLGLAPKVVEEIYDVLRNLKQKGMAMLIIEQNALPLKIADRAMVMHKGRVVREEQATELARDHQTFWKLYLGGLPRGVAEDIRGGSENEYCG